VAEGDTIHRHARLLRETLSGAIDAASAPAPDSPLRRQTRRLDRLVGARLVAAEAHGKHLFLPFDAGLVIHSHLGISGAWHVYEPGQRWRRPRAAAWAALEAGGRTAVQFGGTTLELRTPGELRADPRLRALGPDILATGLRVDAAVAALREAGPATQLGEALLDQRRIAGIGNIFKSEGCFAAGVDPWRPIGEIDDERLAAAVAATRDLMTEAVASRRQPKRVYRRARRPCPRCGTPIRSRGQGDANRTTYWCPGCQS